MFNKVKKSMMLMFIIFLVFNPILQVSASTYADSTWIAAPDFIDVAVSNDGKYIVAVTGNLLQFFSSNSSTPLWYYSSGSANFSSVAVSSDGNQVVAGNRSGRIHYWNNSMVLDQFEDPNWSSVDLGNYFLPPQLDISGNGENVVVAAQNGTDGVLHYFAECITRSTSSEEPTWSDPVFPSGTMYSVDLSTNGMYVAAGGYSILGSNGTVAFWVNASQATPSRLWLSTFNDNDVEVEVSDDGYAVAANDKKNLLYWKDAQNLTGNPTPSWYANASEYGSFSRLDMSSDGNTVILGQWNNSLHCWRDARSGVGELSESWIRLQKGYQDVGGSAISDNGSIIVALSYELDPSDRYPPRTEAYFYDIDGNLLGSYGFGYATWNDALSISGAGDLFAFCMSDLSLYVLTLEELFSYKYFKKSIDHQDEEHILVAQIHPLPDPKKVSVYVELEPDERSYENFTLEPDDVFRIWIELYMNGTWKPLVSKQQFMRRLHPDLIFNFTEFGPNGPPSMLIPSEMWLFMLSMMDLGEWEGPEIGTGTLIIGDISGPYGIFEDGFFPIEENGPLPNLMVGEVLLIGDQIPVAEGIRVWIKRFPVRNGIYPDDDETFTFQIIIQGFGEGATDNIEEILTDPDTGLVEIKKEIKYIEGNITDPETGLVEIKSEIKSIEEKQNTILEILDILLECCQVPVGGLIVSIYPSGFIEILPFSMGLAAGLASLIYLKHKKQGKQSE